MEGDITADTALDLIRAAAETGHAQALTDTTAGLAVGYDVGFGADTDHRGFVRAVMDGFEKGTADRTRLAAQLAAEPGGYAGYLRQTEKEAEA